MKVSHSIILVEREVMDELLDNPNQEFIDTFVFCTFGNKKSGISFGKRNKSRELYILLNENLQALPEEKENKSKIRAFLKVFPKSVFKKLKSMFSRVCSK